jgi:hypothetical protein
MYRNTTCFGTGFQCVHPWFQGNVQAISEFAHVCVTIAACDIRPRNSSKDCDVGGLQSFSSAELQKEFLGCILGTWQRNLSRTSHPPSETLLRANENWFSIYPHIGASLDETDVFFSAIIKFFDFIR